MRVSADDNVELSGSGIDVKLLNIVQDVYQGRASLSDRRHRQLGSPSAVVKVSSDSDDRRHAAQLFDDRWLANIAGMDDQIASF